MFNHNISYVRYTETTLSKSKCPENLTYQVAIRSFRLMFGHPITRPIKYHQKGDLFSFWYYLKYFKYFWEQNWTKVWLLKSTKIWFRKSNTFLIWDLLVFPHCHLSIFPVLMLIMILVLTFIISHRQLTGNNHWKVKDRWWLKGTQSDSQVVAQGYSIRFCREI